MEKNCYFLFNFYLKKWFNNVLTEDTYILKIFDKDVNLFTLTPQQYILITDDGYEIKNIDEESESEESESGESNNDDGSASEYEGAKED